MENTGTCKEVCSESGWRIVLEKRMHKDGFFYSNLIFSWYSCPELRAGIVTFLPVEQIVNVQLFRTGRGTRLQRGDFRSKEEAIYAIEHAVAKLPLMFHEAHDAMTTIVADNLGEMSSKNGKQMVYDKICARWRELVPNLK